MMNEGIGGVQEVGKFAQDIGFLPNKKDEDRHSVIMGGIEPRAFKERLMLAITAVHGCRYRSWLHTGELVRHRDWAGEGRGASQRQCRKLPRR